MGICFVTSHYQMGKLLTGREEGSPRVVSSMDLGISETDVLLQPDGAQFPGGIYLDWGSINEINESINNCFLVDETGISKIQKFSASTNRHYSLFPTKKSPTMLISGIPMHRIKNTDPAADTKEKIRAAKPRGVVLDTATGLGYTAICAASTSSQVLTIELDPTALEIARLNPWSAGLFDNPIISQEIGDSFDLVEGMESDSFDCVIHDPPTLSLAGHLYSGGFYNQLHRVLKPGGRLFHYIGNPHTRAGIKQTKGIIQRLMKSGFHRVEHKPRAFGVSAKKGFSSLV